MVAHNAVGAHAVASIFGGQVTVRGEGWSTPVRRKALATALIAPAFFYSYFTGAPPETITMDKWYRLLSEPVKFKPRLKPGLQQDLFFVNATTTTEALESRWHYPWSEPVRQKPRLKTGLQQAYFAEPSGMTQPEAVLYSKFGYQWSEPVKFKPRLRVGLQQFTAFTNPVPTTEDIEARWHYPWSEPVRFKPRLRTGLQQTLAFYPTPSPFVAYGWYGWLSEPVKFKPRLRTGLQQTHAFHPQPVVPFGWNEPLTEPVRFRPRLKTGLQQYQFYVNATPATDSIESRWHYPWSEPVRFKPRLKVALVPFDNLRFPIVPVSGGFIQGWYTWLSEPVRFRTDGLKAWQQQFLAMPPRLLPNPNITGTLDATERGDIFTAGGTFFNRVSSASVGIIELFPGDIRPPIPGTELTGQARPFLTGIIETTQVSANVGGVEQIQATQSGSVLSSTYAARVSIRIV